MNFLLLSDIHATKKVPIGRLDNVFETFDEKFSFVIDYAKKHNCIILQAGDMSDESRNWNILDYYIEELNGVDLFSVFGQHDMLHRANPDKTPTTLLSLYKANIIKLLNEKPILINDINIYGANWGCKIPKPGMERGTRNILVLHAPISNKAEWDGHDFTHPRYFLKKNPFDLILVGDIHREFCVKQENRYIVNTGPMLRLEANEYNFTYHRPCFYIWNSESLKIKRVGIPHKPAKEVLTRDHIETKKMSKMELDIFASKLKNMKSLKNVRKEKIKKYLRKKINDKRVTKIVMGIINEN